MSKIYGFGNALIDIEIKVSEHQLKDTNIKKGLMKHISQEELESYLLDFSNQINSALPGGSIANSTHAANKHNIETHFSCAIGDDKYGELFVDSFKNDGFWYEDIDCMIGDIASMMLKNREMSILVKGSRSMKMERVVKVLSV